MKTRYRVSYAKTRKTHTYATKKAADAQARWAIGIGNTRSCVSLRLPSGGYRELYCYKRVNGRLRREK